MLLVCLPAVCSKIYSVDGVTVLLLLLIFRYFASEEYKTGVPNPGWFRDYITFYICIFVYIVTIAATLLATTAPWPRPK